MKEESPSVFAATAANKVIRHMGDDVKHEKSRALRIFVTSACNGGGMLPNEAERAIERRDVFKDIVVQL